MVASVASRAADADGSLQRTAAWVAWPDPAIGADTESSAKRVDGVHTSRAAALREKQHSGEIEAQASSPDETWTSAPEPAARTGQHACAITERVIVQTQ